MNDVYYFDLVNKFFFDANTKKIDFFYDLKKFRKTPGLFLIRGEFDAFCNIHPYSKMIYFDDDLLKIGIEIAVLKEDLIGEYSYIVKNDKIMFNTEFESILSVKYVLNKGIEYYLEEIYDCYNNFKKLSGINNL